jgi:effector-binding domain-containing protein
VAGVPFILTVTALVYSCVHKVERPRKIGNIAAALFKLNSKDSVMKKWLLVLLVVLIIGVAGIYFLIPSKITVTRAVPVTATQEGTLRFLTSLPNWKKFWPVAKPGDSSLNYSYGGYNYNINKFRLNAVEINIRKNNNNLESGIYIIPFQVDSIRIQWTGILPPTNNPFKRIQNYFSAKDLTSAFEIILDSMSRSLSKVETIYGIVIKKDTIPYQNYIATKRYLSQYPSITAIYEMVDELKAYAASVGVQQLDKPIFDVKPTEEAEYVTQVAIPIDKDIPGNEKFSHKWMMKGGNVLTAEVKGGIKEIENAKAQINQYIADHRRSIIALPWLMLITDRRAEPDSSKWITRLYYPVI